MAHPALRAAFDAKIFIVAPGVFDMISARVADGMGFDCLYGTSNNRFSIKIDKLLTNSQAGWLGEH